MRIMLPEKAKYIIDTIKEAGFEAYVVGGCVRDSILGREPEDWDITTSATPSQVKGLFPRTIDTGIQHGTVTVMLQKDGFEVTTYRIDGKYEDGRHPKEVTFTPCLEEDLRRRDFTMNAMAYNDTEGLVDIFGGLEDIQAGIIRCVGEPEARFREDALRIMRAVRFSAQLGYTIESDTKAAITKLAKNLTIISAERIQTELVKLLLSPHPEYLRVAYETGITQYILPEFDRAMETEQRHPHHCYSVGEHILHALVEVPPERYLRLAMLLHDIGKPQTKTIDEEGLTHFHGHAAVSEGFASDILHRLRFDNETIRVVTKLVRHHDFGNSENLDMRFVRRMVNQVGEDIFPMLFAIKRGDILAQSIYKREEKLSRLAQCQQLYDQICAEKQCVSLKTMAISGKDLIAEGMPPGKELGVVLQRLLEWVLDHPEENDKQKLIDKARTFF